MSFMTKALLCGLYAILSNGKGRGSKRWVYMGENIFKIKIEVPDDVFDAETDFKPIIKPRRGWFFYTAYQNDVGFRMASVRLSVRPSV